MSADRGPFARRRFVEKVERNVLAYEFRRRCIASSKRNGAVVRYNGFILDEYRTDLLVEDSALAEASASRGWKSNTWFAAFEAPEPLAFFA
jgi:hypothetical protein